MILVLNQDTISSSDILLLEKITKAKEGILNKATKISRENEFGKKQPSFFITRRKKKGKKKKKKEKNFLNL